MITKQIRVLNVIHGMNCGGAENFIMNVYRQIDKSKVQFDFMVHTKNKCFFDDEINELGGRIFSMPHYMFWNYFQYKKEVSNFFAGHPEISIVHGHLGSCAGIYLNEAKKKGIYTIAHSHNTNSKEISIKSLIYRIGNFKTRKVADYFFSCSKEAGNDRFGKDICNSSRHELVRNAIDVQRYSFSDMTRNRIRKSFQIKKDAFVIGHVGRFEDQKNHSFLIDIFASLKKRSKDAILFLVGDGILQEEIKKKVDSLGLTKDVIFAGLRKDVNDLFQVMDVFILPSKYEGLPLVMVEAQAAGLKCIISNQVPNDCIITDNVQVLSLKDSPDFWSSEICNYRNYQRQDMKDMIVNAGFDINSLAQHLQNFYLSKV